MIKEKKEQGTNKSSRMAQRLKNGDNNNVIHHRDNGAMRAQPQPK